MSGWRDGRTYTLTGELREDARSLVLDEAVPTAAGKKGRVTLQTIEPLPRVTNKPSHEEALAAIHARLKAAGHVPPSAEEVARRVAEERDSWD